MAITVSGLSKSFDYYKKELGLMCPSAAKQLAYASVHTHSAMRLR
ncbi:MAG TPA: hypothetical protein VFU22_24875 [Roseiflexaceae bacterium]|nr:hypothetical protein [Roseiflexaceae bacterium]